MKMTIYLRIARDMDGTIRVAASTSQKWDALASQAQALFTKPKALPTIHTSVEVSVDEKKLAGLSSE